jgi:hypothetical protein
MSLFLRRTTPRFKLHLFESDFNLYFGDFDTKQVETDQIVIMKKTRGRGRKRARKDEISQQEDAELRVDDQNVQTGTDGDEALRKDDLVEVERQVDNGIDTENVSKNATNGRVEEESDEDAVPLYQGHGKSNKEIRRGNECPYLDTISRQVRDVMRLILRCWYGVDQWYEPVLTNICWVFCRISTLILKNVAQCPYRE